MKSGIVFEVKKIPSLKPCVSRKGTCRYIGTTVCILCTSTVTFNVLSSVADTDPVDFKRQIRAEHLSNPYH
jgi:hypothetical protein